MSTGVDALAVPVVSWSDTDGHDRQVRSLRTRHALLLAAAEEITRHGYHAASLRGILDAADLTKGALYFHFGSKEDLARGVVSEMFDSWSEVAADIRGRGLDPLWTLLLETDAATARRMYDPIVRGGSRIIADSGLFETVRSAWADAWIEDTTRLLTDARDAGLLRPRARPGHMARSLVALTTGHFHLAGHVHLVGSTPAFGDYAARMNDMWEGVLPVIAAEDWTEDWERSCWHARPAPDPAAYRCARRP